MSAMPRRLNKQTWDELRRLFVAGWSLGKLAKLIADNLSKAGWSWGCVAAVDSQRRTIWIADAHRGDGKRLVVRSEEKLTAFLELARIISTHLLTKDVEHP